ncbi:MAG: s-methyl-5-thioribose-1-phosphate isomerase [Ardenticatenales bacterium]|nr:s-methyl-5-thioribose-1-phosphate isomerase [Ardenticatenales bacterium]
MSKEPDILRPALLSDRFNTLSYDRESHEVIVLDRRVYPFETRYERYGTVEGVARSIEEMVVQGGPPLAYVAGLGLALAAQSCRGQHVAEQRGCVEEAAKRLVRTRPTADDLHWLMEHALVAGLEAIELDEDAFEAILGYVEGEIARGNEVSRACGRHAASLLESGDKVLTHCFAGAALNYMLFYAREQGKEIELIASETRPYLQGARLTASQAVEMNIPVTVITDGMAAHLMSEGNVTKYVTAADRIALDGSICNKVGTFEHAIAARYHNIPFYVLGYDGPDPATPTGKDIPIEERNSREVLFQGGQRIAVEGAQARYPAFDVTPPGLVSRIITERGIFEPGEMAAYFDA